MPVTASAAALPSSHGSGCPQAAHGAGSGCPQGMPTGLAVGAHRAGQEADATELHVGSSPDAPAAGGTLPGTAERSCSTCRLS